MLNEPSVFEQLKFYCILSSLQLVLCHVAAVKRLSVHHHGIGNIFSGPLGSWAHSESV